MGIVPIILYSLLGLGILGLAAFLWPFPRPRPAEIRERSESVDERDTMFSRRELSPDSERYENYYERYPERRRLDELWRAKPGLMSPQSHYAHPLAFAAAGASFEAVDELHPLVDGAPAETRTEISAEDASEFFRQWAVKLGALDCGVTLLRPQHLYSMGGRRERYGQAVHNDHRFAIAFTVEMDHRMMRSAPDAPTLMESAQQYVSAGIIAVQIATAIRRLGYAARAHIDANYQLVCPLVARDAGLGEIGRMGLLMTPHQGPRVRIGVVSTELELTPTPRQPDATVEDFCRHCRKCATVCPSAAIPFEDAREVGGVRRWVIDPVACFSYWCDAGTDCGRCVVTCPYAHQQNAFHDFVRWGIRHSPLFRRFAVHADDWVYGRRPKRLPRPGWIP